METSQERPCPSSNPVLQSISFRCSTWRWNPSSYAGAGIRESENKASIVILTCYKSIWTDGLGYQRGGGQIISTCTTSAATPLWQHIGKLHLIKVQEALPERTMCGLLKTHPPFNSLLYHLTLVLHIHKLQQPPRPSRSQVALFWSILYVPSG